MANLVNQLGDSIGSFGWASAGNIAFIVTIILMLFLFFVGIFIFIWWKSFYVKVNIYEPYGQVKLSEKDLEKVKEEAKNGTSKTLKESMIKFDMVKYKKTHGKYTTVKGTPYFNTFMPFKKIQPIPMEFMYDNGVHLLRLSKEILIPIPKPKTIINISEKVSISVVEHNQWTAWNNLMADKINNKFQDIDAQKKVAMYFIVGIVSIVLLGGFFFWLMYSSANKGWDAAEKFNTVANSLTSGSPK